GRRTRRWQNTRFQETRGLSARTGGDSLQRPASASAPERFSIERSLSVCSLNQRIRVANACLISFRVRSHVLTSTLSKANPWQNRLEKPRKDRQKFERPPRSPRCWP